MSSPCDTVVDKIMCRHSAAFTRALQLYGEGSEEEIRIAADSCSHFVIKGRMIHVAEHMGSIGCAGFKGCIPIAQVCRSVKRQHIVAAYPFLDRCLEKARQYAQTHGLPCLD